MKYKKIIKERFQDYKVPSMFICTASCSGKCCIEGGFDMSVCSNDGWRSADIKYMDDNDIIDEYLGNPITHAVIFGGLEPFEQFDDVYSFIKTLREDGCCLDDVVIYTGYNRNEIKDMVDKLKPFGNIVIKFGRYRPDRPHRYDAVLGVELASDNQFAERI